MTPANIDFEFRSLSLENDYEELKMVMKMLQKLMVTNTNFEIVQILLNVFLRVTMQR